MQTAPPSPPEPGLTGRSGLTGNPGPDGSKAGRGSGPVPGSRLGPEWNRQGALLMTLAMGGFATEDVLVKSVSAVMPLGQILVCIGLIGVLVFSGMALRAGEAPFTRVMLAPPMLVRSMFEVAGRLFYALALALAPLSSNSALLQAAPLVVVAGAALVFGERVGPRRWLATLAGFCGVLLILRPGTDAFGWASLLAVAGTIGFAGRDLATRAAPAGMSHRQLGALGFLMLMLAGLLLLPFGAAPTLPAPGPALLLLGASVTGILAYYALTAAMRTGEIGAVTPFRYTRLLFGILLGVLVFGERPDLMTAVGALVVVVAGIMAMRRT